MRLVWKLEEKIYQIKSLLEVMQDGLCNDVVGINQDHYATTLRVVVDKVDEIQDAINEDYRQRREDQKIGEYAEYDEDGEDGEDGEDSLFAGASIFSDETPGWRAKSDLFTGDDLQDSEPKESEAGEEDSDRFATGSLGVTLVQEHEDGSATYEIHGSKSQMQKLFSAFFADALTRGIDEAERSTSKWINKNKIVKKARELEERLRKWEVTDDYDYLPEVQKTREELTELLNKGE